MWKAVIFYLVSGIIVEGLIADPADGTLEVSLRTIMAFSSIATYLIIFKKCVVKLESMKVLKNGEKNYSD